MKTLLRWYQQQSRLLDSGRFGQGLWPIDPELGQLLSWLICFFRLQRGIEVGAGVGYSTCWMAEGFRQHGGKLTSFEYFLPKVEQWERHMKRFFGEDYEDFVEMVPTDVTRWVPHVGREKIDFVFFDQRKADYLPHLELLLPALKKGAFLCADNVISHEKAARPYLDLVRSDKRFSSYTVSVGAGLELSRYWGSS